MTCPTCDRLMTNYSAALSRGQLGAAARALRKYDAHRAEVHGRGRPVGS